MLNIGKYQISLENINNLNWDLSKPIKDKNAISNFEKQFKIKLPKDFIDFINKHNGAFSTKKFPALSGLFSFNKDDNNYIFEVQNEVPEKYKGKLIIFGFNSNGRLYFDYSKSSTNPSVAELDEDSGKFILMYKSFTDLLNEMSKEE